MRWTAPALLTGGPESYPGDTSDVLVATKGGHLRPGDGSWTVDGSPAHLRAAAEASLKALGVDAIGLYQFHRPDPKVPYEESIGALAGLLRAGKIRLAGISNASIEQIDIARRVLGEGNLACVQNQFSPAFRSSEGELRHAAAHGIAFLPWSPLGGIGRAGRLGARHTAFQKVAGARGVSPQQVTLAWMLAKAPVVIPIPAPAGRSPSSTRPKRPTWCSATASSPGSTPAEDAGPPTPGGRAGQATNGWPDSLAMGRPAACQPIMPSETLCACQPAPASARAA